MDDPPEGNEPMVQQVVDIGFVLTVMAVCFQMLFASGDRSQRRSQRWQQELRFLEGTLRELIGEASAAGNNLNRNLLKRKEELGILIQQLDQAKAKAGEPEFPNPSWVQPKQARPAAEPIELVQQAAQVDDQVTIRVAQTARPAPRPKTDLLTQIEVMKSKAPISMGFSGSAGDQTVYRIAERLLRAGQEIHVVARKLEVPVSEIRLIEAQMRGESGGDVSSDGQQGSFESEEYRQSEEDAAGSASSPEVIFERRTTAL